MADVLDVLFRFPADENAGPEFVTSALNRLTVPAVVVDARMQVRLTNLQGQEMFLKLESGRRHKTEKHGSKKRRMRTFPASLRRTVTSSLKSGRARLVPGVEIAGLNQSLFDILISPGQIQGVDLGFIVMLRPDPSKAGDMDGVLDRLLESFDVAAVYVDRELCARNFNDRYLSAFGRQREELQGTKLSRMHDSEQAVILERQVAHLMATGNVRYSRADVLPTAKRGAVSSSVIAWPFSDRDGACLGLFGLMRPTPMAAVDDVALGYAKRRFFAGLVEMMSEAVFVTHLDGRILVMNGAGRALLRPDSQIGTGDVKTAIPWCHPEIIEDLYEDVKRGPRYSVVLTDVDTAADRRLFRVRASGFSELGDIISLVFLIMDDVTDEERVRRLLAETTSNLASEKAILDHVLDHIGVTFSVVGKDLTMLRVNDQLAGKLQVEPQDLIGKKIFEANPYVRDTGLVAQIKTAIDRRQEIHIPRFVHVTRGGTEVPLRLSIIPISFEGREACIVITENLAQLEEHQAEAARRSQIHEKLIASMAEAVVLLDKDGIIEDVNPVVERMTGRSREDLVGKDIRKVLNVEEKDLLLDYLRKAYVSRRTVTTGCLRLTRKDLDQEFFVDITLLPLFSGEGSLDGVAVVTRLLTELKNLERQIEEYTENLERIVDERTKEITSANALLEATVGRLASMAKSGMMLSTLKDMESVMRSFLTEARDVLGADFVSVALVESVCGTSKTTYYSSGSAPPPGTIPGELVERGLSRLVLATASQSDVRLHGPNLLTVDFAVGEHRALLLAWKKTGEFTSIDTNLGELLCTHLGFSMPITTYVTDLRRERDRSQCLRRIAFRVAGMASVAGAIRIVAEELAETIRADRFFWFVSNNDAEVWASEIHNRRGIGSSTPKHVGCGDSECLGLVLKACHDSHKLFCERFPRFGRQDFSPYENRARVAACPFVKEDERGALTRCVRELLRGAGLIGHDEGSLSLAPVTLSATSWGMICAYTDVGTAFSPEDSCFMCLAASTVGHMWQAADAASNVRRLEAAGQTLSELAHDLKYPLMRLRDSISAISCCDSDILKRDPAFEDVGEEVDRLNLLAEELIDISNAGARRSELIDVAGVIDHCVSLTLTDSAGKSVSIERQTPQALPPVFASKKDFKTVILNVLTNCIDAAGEGGSVKVDVTQDRSGDRGGAVRMTITDSGPGVPLSETARIFDPFYSKKDGGSGLGLFSAKKRANANGGDVVCEIGEDGRSRFVIWFPLASA